MNSRTCPVARLRAIDPHLGLKCYRWGATDQWAIVWQWSDTDARMARVTSGEIDPATAVDILAHVPLDMTPDQVPGYVEPMLKSLSSSNAYGYVDALLAKVKTANEQHKASVWAPTMEKAEEVIETRAGHLFADTRGRIAKVYQNGGKRR